MFQTCLYGVLISAALTYGTFQHSTFIDTNLRLEHSRSHRILWLLEELNVSYELKTYKRNKQYRAGPEFDKLHPLGKSPVIEVFYENGNSKVLAETGHIINFIVSTYDTTGKLTPETENDKLDADYYLHYAEGTLQPLLVSLLINTFAVKQAPFGTKFLVSKVVEALNDSYYLSELKKNLAYLEGHMKKQHESGSEYFVGKKLSVADIILHFPMNNLFGDQNRLIGGSDPKELYPNLHKWAENTKTQKSLIKANELVRELDTKL